MVTTRQRLIVGQIYQFVGWDWYFLVVEEIDEFAVKVFTLNMPDYYRKNESLVYHNSIVGQNCVRMCQ